MEIVSRIPWNNFVEEAYEAPYLVVDTEGNGKDVRCPAVSGAVTMGVAMAYRLHGVAFADYGPFKHNDIDGNLGEEELKITKELIEEHPCIVMHNAKHDLPALELLGINRMGKFYDTMLMAHWVNENLKEQGGYGLDNVSRLYGGNPKAMPADMEMTIKVFGWGSVPSYMMRPYSANDALITLELFEKLLKEFEKQGFK